MGVIAIYKIISPSNKVYVGQTINFDNRLKTYKALHCAGQKRLYSSFLKYGVINHTFEIIEICLPEDLNTRERYWQEYYNVLSDQFGLNCKLTKTKDKSGKHSEETKAKIAASHLGKLLSIDHKAKLKKAKQFISEETRNKIRQFNLGKKWSLKTTEFHRKRMIGNTHTKGMLPINARIVIDLSAGVFYYSIKEAAISINMKRTTLEQKLRKPYLNNTNLKIA